MTPTGVLPAAPPVPYLGGFKAKPAKLPAGKRRNVTVKVTLKGEQDKVRFELQRRKGGQCYRTKRLGSRKLKPGKPSVKLTIPAQRPGVVRIVAIGDASSANRVSESALGRRPPDREV